MSSETNPIIKSAHATKKKIHAVTAAYHFLAQDTSIVSMCPEAVKAADQILADHMRALAKAEQEGAQ